MTTIGITGSTGQVGARVAQALADDPLPGMSPRLIVREAARAPRHPGFEIASTEYGDADAAVRALEGVDLLFMVSGSENPDRRAQHRTFIEAAARAGVRHLVYTSFFGADPDAVFTLGRDHADAEAAIHESGMTFTLLRDNFYSDFFPMMADEQGVIRGPAREGRVAGVARADVADVALAVLRDPASFEYATLELTGPEALTLHEVTARLTAALARPFRYEEETLEEAYRSRLRWSEEQWQLDAWVSTYTAIADGEVARVTGDVERITGHPARSIEQAVAEH